jgi:hypothetical protein
MVGIGEGIPDGLAGDISYTFHDFTFQIKLH